MTRPRTRPTRRNPFWSAILVALSLVGAAATYAQGKQYVFVENTNSGDVSVIDAASLKVEGTISVGMSPDDIVSSPKHDVLYVSRILRGPNGRTTGTGEVVAVDPVSRTVLWRVPLHGVPNHLMASPDGKRVFVTLVNGPWVAVVDPAKREVIDSVDVGTGPHDVEVSHDGRHVYVGLIRGTGVTEFDAATNKVIRKIDLGENVRPIALAHDESRLYVQLSRYHGFVVVDLRSGAILKKVPMPLPEGTKLEDPLPATVNHGLRITSDGNYLVANGSIVNETAIFHLPDLRLVATVPVGHDPNWIVFSPDGKRFFVSNRQSDDVSVIDFATKKEIARLKVGKYPERMAAIVLASRATGPGAP